MKKDSSLKLLIAIVSVFLIAGCVMFYKLFIGSNRQGAPGQRIIEASAKSKKVPKLCVSTYVNGKSQIWAYDTAVNKWSLLVDNRNVMLTSFISREEDKVYFIDALGDTDPWQVYCYDLKNGTTTQITHDTLGKGFITPGIYNTFYILQPNSYGMTRVFKIENNDNKYREAPAVEADRDLDTQRFCITGNKVISAFYSLSDYNEKYKNSKNGTFIKDYILTITDEDGKSVTLGKYPRKDISLMRVNRDNTKLLMATVDKNSNNQLEILDLESGKITKTITEKDICKNSDITAIEDLGVNAVWGYEDNIIYLSAVYKDAQSIGLSGVKAYCSGLYKIDINNNSIQRIGSIGDSIITDISANYN